jgi:hypothetical protein
MLSSGMSCRVALVGTDVLKEPIITIIRVTSIGELGITLAQLGIIRKVSFYKIHTA